ncbi:MAG: ABC transporter permease [Rhizobiales bacterium]|nr:ABC transporter permease [Hyphomicrobiales bacterium]
MLDAAAGAAAKSPRRATPIATVSNFVAIYGLLLVLLLIIAVFGALRPSTFFSAINFNNILMSQSVTAMLALAVMMPLATKQFDLSVGFHLGMAQTLIVGLQVQQGLDWPVAAVLILFLSLLVGIANGMLVTLFQIDSFIATMGTGTLLYGVTNWYSNGEQISGMGLSDSFINLTQIVYGVPLPAVYVVIISLALWIATEYLPVGRNLYVIGANVRAAQLTGINVGGHVMGAFVVAGLLSGFAGIVLGSILQTGTPSVGPEYLLPAFAAALLGATSIKPGRVNVIGTIISVLVLAFSFSGVQQLGAPFYVQYFFNGAILIVAVGLSVYAARRRQRAAVNTSKA